MQADWQGLMAILDYRRARRAIDLFNDGAKGFDELQKRPDLVQILVEMGRAQAGPDVTIGEMLAAKQATWTEDDEDDGERR